MSNLFRKFVRIGDARREQHIAGEGLGLAICKGIVEAHGGRIWAESGEEGHGTRIVFTVPLSVDAPQPPAGDTSAGRQTDWRILAVDDERQALWLLQNILSDHGYTVFGTGNPDEMMRLLEMEQPDLILLDLMMPGTSGFDLMTRIRGASQVPIIFLSANDQEENITNALNMGADDYIVKPYSSTELLARVRASLRKRGAAAPPTSRQAYRSGDLTIDFAARSVTLSGRPVQLSGTEYKLLFELSTNAGRVLTHSQILQRVWGDAHFGDSQILRAAVKNLRHKLGDDARSPKYIFTDAGVGYHMVNGREQG